MPTPWLKTLHVKVDKLCVAALCALPVPAFATSAASGAETLCNEGEEVILSCEVRHSKTFSFCRSGADPGTIAYRFGRKGSIELEHKDRTGQASSFFYGHYFRAQVDVSHFGFRHGDYTYEGFREWDEETAPEAGVRVRTPSGDQFTLMCVKELRFDRLYDSYDVACDDDDVVGCAK